MVAINHRPDWGRFVRVIGQFYTSEVRRTAIFLTVALLFLLLGIAGLNIVNSYVGRDVMSDLAERRTHAFYLFAALYVGVFVASGAVSALERYAEETLALTGRTWLTQRFVDSYLNARTYLYLHGRPEVDNPDQRISEDAREFSATVLSFCILFFNGTVTAVSFSVVLWSISPTLLAVCIGYAVLGSGLTVLLGYPLIHLNYRQLDREARFRSALINVREHAKAVAVARAEGPLRRRLRARFGEVVANFRKMIRVNLRLNLSTNIYNFLPQIIPILVVGPQYIRGDIEFGVVTQSAMAFTQLIAALSLLVSQFQVISQFTAAVARLEELANVIRANQAPAVVAIQTVETPSRIAYERLTLLADGGERPLVRELTLAIGASGRLLVTGPNEEARYALFLASAGLWSGGRGRVERPPLAELQFVPQRPYMIPGTLRDQFYAAAHADDERVQAVLEAVGLGDLPERAGGLDEERDWLNLLGLGEQQRLALARVLLARPRFAFLDRVETVLGIEATAELLGRLAAARIDYLTFAETDELSRGHDAVLRMNVDGGWTVLTARPGRVRGGEHPGAA